MFHTVIISVAPKDQLRNARRKDIDRLLAAAHRKELRCAGVSALYQLDGNPGPAEVERIAAELLCDPVAEEFAIGGAPKVSQSFYVDVWPKAGVADPVGESVVKAIKDLGILCVSRVSSGTRYEFSGSRSLNGKTEDAAAQFAARELLNPLIQECKITLSR